MAKSLPRSKMYRYCLADIAKGLFNGMIGNYLLYFFQPTVKSGIPSLLPQNKLLIQIQQYTRIHTRCVDQFFAGVAAFDHSGTLDTVCKKYRAGILRISSWNIWFYSFISF